MTRKQPPPVLPGPDCATIAPLLPTLDAYDHTDEEEAARAREHLRTCDWCRREYAAHTIVTGALRRHFSEPSPGALPFLAMEHIVNNVDTQDNLTPLSTTYPPTSSTEAPLTHPHRTPGRLTGIAAVAAAVLLVGLAATLFAMFTRTSSGAATHQSTPTATAVRHQPPVPLHLPAGANLLGISMTSPTDGWAVGVVISQGRVKDKLLLRYHNGQWSIWPGTLPQLQLLLSSNSLSMTSPNDGWLTGVGGFLHYTNNQWVVVSVPGVGAINKVHMSSPTDGWAMGFIQTPDKQDGAFGMLHYSNGAWSIVALPAALQGLRVSTGLDFSVTESGECWLMYHAASGDNTTILRYAGGSFQVAYTLPHVQGWHITMRSSQDGWLTGNDTSGNVLYHFDGTAWRKIAIPSSINQRLLASTVIISPSGEAWLPAGSDADASVITHYRNGSWEEVQGPPGVDTATFTLVAADEGWAIGSGGDRSALYHYQNGNWTEYPNKSRS